VRHEPGTGENDCAYLFRFIDELGYDGWIDCEYELATTTDVGPGRMTPFR